MLHDLMMFVIVPKCLLLFPVSSKRPSSTPARADGLMTLLSFVLYSFDGSGTNLLSNGDAITTPIKPTIETAELISKTGGVFVVIKKDECNTGLLLANNSVMKPM